MIPESFKPCYPDDGRVGYRLRPTVWAECVWHDEQEAFDDDWNLIASGVAVEYVIYQRGMSGMPPMESVDWLLETIGKEYTWVRAAQISPVEVGGRAGIVVMLDCWEGVPGA